MCSVLGIVKSTGIDDALLDKAQNLLDYTVTRGPDQQGNVCIGNTVYLGSNRLSIIGRDEVGKMPMTSLHGEYWITYNGELYNYGEIKDLLIKDGFTFKSKTDTEVVLNAYIKYGESFVEKLNGVFAFIIYDKTNHKIVAGRDRFGARPLYYSINNHTLYLSSDFKLISDLTPRSDRFLDYEALTSFIYCRFVPGSKTIASGIHKLCPAETKTWDAESLNSTSRIFWTPRMELRPFNQGEFDEHLFQAIKYTTTADITPDILLSGGLDSAGIAAIMTKLGFSNINSFTFAFNNKNLHNDISDAPSYSITTPNFDERDRAKSIAAFLQIKNQGFVFDYNIGINEFTNMIDILGEPLGSVNAIGNYIFAKELKGKTSLVLAGTGSDELLGGYLDLYFKGRNNLLKSVSDPRMLLQALSDFDTGEVKTADFLETSATNPDYLNNYLEMALSNFDYKKYPNEVLNQLALFELYFALPGWENDQADRLYLWHSIEERPAFLENNFVDYTLTIPSKNKIDKKPLRDALSKLVPSKVINGAKYPGMSTPEDLYYTSWFKELTNDLQYSPLPIWNSRKIDTLFNEDKPMSTNFDVLYRMVYLQYWIKHNHYLN